MGLPTPRREHQAPLAPWETSSGAGPDATGAASAAEGHADLPEESSDTRPAPARPSLARKGETAAKATQATGATVKRAGQAAQTAGKAASTAGRSAQVAGKTAFQAGKAASATKVGAVIGVPMMLGGALGMAGGKAADVAGRGAAAGGAAANRAGQVAEKAGKTGAEFAAALPVAGTAGQPPGEPSGTDSAQAGPAAAGPAAAGPSAADKAFGFAKSMLGAGGSGGSGSGTGGPLGGLNNLAERFDFTRKGVSSMGAQFGETAQKWATRTYDLSQAVLSKAFPPASLAIRFAPVVLGAPLALLLLLFAMVSMSSPSAQPHAAADEEAMEEVPSTTRAAYESAGASRLIPWPIVAAIGEVTTRHGTFDPYTNQDIEDGFWESGGKLEPLGGVGGYGPLLASRWLVDNYLGGNTDAAQDPGVTLEAMVRALDDHASLKSSGELCAAALAAQNLEPVDVTDENVPDECRTADGQNPFGDPEAPDGGAPLALELTAGEELAMVLAAAAGPDEVDETDGATVDPLLLRYAAFDRGALPHDGEYGQHVKFWYEVLSAVPLIELTGNEMCLTSRDRLSVPQVIELEFRCAATTILDQLEVGTVDAADQLTVAEGRDAVNTLVDEAVAVSWLYNEHGTATSCETDTMKGGVFPLASEYEWYDSNGDGTNDARRVVVDRCKVDEVSELLAERLLAGESSRVTSRPGSVYEQVSAGWVSALPSALGSSNTFRSTGKVNTGRWGEGVDRDQCAVALADALTDAMSNPDLFEEAWGSVHGSGVTRDKFKEMWASLRTWSAWQAVDDVCSPAYVENDRERMVTDMSWSIAFTQAVARIESSTGEQFSSAPVAVRRFVSYHTLVQARELTHPTWGVTAAFERLSDVDLHDASPPWTPMGNMNMAGEVVRVALEYIGESCEDLGLGAGGSILNVSTGTEQSSGERFDRAKAAAQALWDVGFRGEDLTMLVAIAGPESQWQPAAENPTSSAVGVWQVMWSVHQSKLAPFGITYDDLKRVEPNAFATKLIFDESVAMWGYADRWKPWQVTHAGYDMVTDTYMQMARQAVAEQLGALANAPAPEGGPQSPGSALDANAGMTCGFGDGAGTLLTGAGDWMCPVAGSTNFTDDWGFARGGGTRSHEGLDMFGERGTPLVAMADGVVNSTRYSQTGGNSIRVTTDDPEATYWFYTHLDAVHPAMHDGKRVTAGEVIGFMGDTGNARGTPVHLHIERHPGGWKNPQPLFALMAEICAENRTNG